MIMIFEHGTYRYRYRYRYIDRDLIETHNILHPAKPPTPAKDLTQSHPFNYNYTYIYIFTLILTTIRTHVDVVQLT